MEHRWKLSLLQCRRGRGVIISVSHVTPNPPVRLPFFLSAGQYSLTKWINLNALLFTCIGHRPLAANREVISLPSP